MKRFARSNGLDTALYKNLPLPFVIRTDGAVGYKDVNEYYSKRSQRIRQTKPWDGWVQIHERVLGLL